MQSYKEIFPQRMGEALMTVYGLGGDHAVTCGEPVLKDQHDQIKNDTARIITDTVANAGYVGLRLDVMEAKLRELGVDPDTLVPAMEDMTIDVITISPGQKVSTPYGDIAIDVI